MNDVLCHAPRSPRFRRWFARHTRGMIRRAFHEVRITPQAVASLRQLSDHDGPALAVSNHAAWWDPLIALRLAECFMPDRPLAAPIELEQYHRFDLLRKIGLFGLDHRHPEALQAMRSHVRTETEANGNLLICITPQGALTDVRQPIHLRPGAAALAADLPEARVITLCIEYSFWLDRRPEVFLHAQHCEVPNEPSRVAWHRSLTHSLQTTADTLAAAVTARDSQAFTALPDASWQGGGTAINPVYDLWLRLRGVGSRIRPPAAEAAERGA